MLPPPFVFFLLKFCTHLSHLPYVLLTLPIPSSLVLTPSYYLIKSTKYEDPHYVIFSMLMSLPPLFGFKYSYWLTVLKNSSVHIFLCGERQYVLPYKKLITSTVVLVKVTERYR